MTSAPWKGIHDTDTVDLCRKCLLTLVKSELGTPERQRHIDLFYPFLSSRTYRIMLLDAFSISPIPNNV